MKEIIVTIYKDGTVVTEAEGYKGASCIEATNFIEKAIGSMSIRTKKPEYDQSANENEHINLGH